MNKWISESMNEWMNEWMNVFINELINQSKHTLSMWLTD